MFCNDRRKRMDAGPSLKEPRGQVLLETLVMAMFLAGFFALLLAFTDENRQGLNRAQWSQRRLSK